MFSCLLFYQTPVALLTSTGGTQNFLALQRKREYNFFDTALATQFHVEYLYVINVTFPAVVNIYFFFSHIAGDGALHREVGRCDVARAFILN